MQHLIIPVAGILWKYVVVSLLLVGSVNAIYLPEVNDSLLSVSLDRDVLESALGVQEAFPVFSLVERGHIFEYGLLVVIVLSVLDARARLFLHAQAHLVGMKGAWMERLGYLALQLCHPGAPDAPLPAVSLRPHQRTPWEWWSTIRATIRLTLSIQSLKYRPHAAGLLQ